MFTVEEAARKIEADTRRVIQSSAKKSVPSEALANAQKIENFNSKAEESKNDDKIKEGETSKFKQHTKYQIPVKKTNLESIAFSDIVNYESNDDMLSLTGDRRQKKSNNMGSKNINTDNSIAEGKLHHGFHAFSRPQTQHILQETT